MRKQCELLGVSRSSLYYTPNGESELNLKIMEYIDKEFTEQPVTGVERMTSKLALKYGIIVNHKRVRRLMRLMCLMAIYPKPRTTIADLQHKKYPNLVHKLKIDHANQVWCTDITYVKINGGFMYLTVIMDMYSRRIISWSLSNTLDTNFCLETLNEALSQATPDIFHSDQGCQYTSNEFTDVLKNKGIKISMAGKGRCFDNILQERFWRSYKYEQAYLYEHSNGKELYEHTRKFIDYYNYKRPHSSLGGLTPELVYGNTKLAQLLNEYRDKNATGALLKDINSQANLGFIALSEMSNLRNEGVA